MSSSLNPFMAALSKGFDCSKKVLLKYRLGLPENRIGISASKADSFAHKERDANVRGT